MQTNRQQQRAQEENVNSFKVTECISKCKLDETRSYCIGCNRDIFDIVRWAEIPKEEKSKILNGNRREIH